MGVVWRFVDMFNYYAFEVSGFPKFVRCIRVLKGQYTIMAKIEDESFA